MGVVTSAHGIRIAADPYPFPRPSPTAGTVTIAQPTVVVVSGGSGTPPTPVLVVPSATTGYVPHAVIAQAFGTTAGSSAITSYSFNWGDGTAVSNTTKSIGGAAKPVPIAYHRYTVAGTYTLSMSVTDVNGNVVSQSRTITVSARPAATVTVNPGNDVVTALNNAAAGAVVQINAGTYTATGRWTPKSNQIVYANGAVTITGGSSMDYFALFSTATGVVFQGIRLTAFTTWALQFGASGGSGASAVFKDVEADTNGRVGVVTGALNGYHGGTIVLDNCHFHHNRTYNTACGDGSTVYIIGGEYNNGFTDTSGNPNPTWEGSHKHVHSTGDYIVGANFHDNGSFGAWWDGNNSAMYACLNTFTNNWASGLFCEINNAALGGGSNNIPGNLDGSGYSCRFLFNNLSGNGYPAHATIPLGNNYWANIEVAKSNKVEVAYNWIDGGAHGIILDFEVSRAEGTNLANISVHDNDVRLREDYAGGGAGVGRMGFRNSYAGTAYSLSAVTFTNNHYFAAHDSSASGWTHFIAYIGTSEIPCDFAQWKATYGYDTSGSTMSLDTAWPH